LMVSFPSSSFFLSSVGSQSLTIPPPHPSGVCRRCCRITRR
jgi:hypothetical protein